MPPDSPFRTQLSIISLASGHEPEDPLHLADEPSSSVVEVFALHLLKDPVGLTPEDAEKDEKIGEQLFAAARPAAAQMSRRSSLCQWKSAPEVPSDKHLTIKYSPAISNPHATSPHIKRGVFVRVSIGAIGGEWFWVVKREDELNDFLVVPLDINGV